MKGCQYRDIFSIEFLISSSNHGVFYTFMMTSEEYSFLSRKVELRIAQGFANAIRDQFGISDLDAYICASF
jgi:hypothetical protein